MSSLARNRHNCEAVFCGKINARVCHVYNSSIRPSHGRFFCFGIIETNKKGDYASTSS